MKKPLIGLTPQYNPDNNTIWMRPQYTNALFKSGALPVLFEQTASPETISDYCDRADGILFTGGEDIDPKYYGEEVHPDCGRIIALRDTFELLLYKEAARRDMPIFGICRGIQLINVGAGGSLYQHINGHSNGVRHDVAIARGTRLYGILKADNINTNSYHHQAVKAPAPNMTAAAWSDVPESGRIIEAICDQNARFNLSVQWHPENMFEDDEFSRKIFAAFVSACV